MGDVAGTAAGKLAGYGPGRCDMGAFRRRFAHVGWKFQSVELVLEITRGRSIDSMYCVDARVCTVSCRVSTTVIYLLGLGTKPHCL